MQTIMESESESISRLVEFTLQGRTEPALDADGNPTKATIFSAFAAKDARSDVIHVQLANNNTGKGLTYKM